MSYSFDYEDKAKAKEELALERERAFKDSSILITKEQAKALAKFVGNTSKRDKIKWGLSYTEANHCTDFMKSMVKEGLEFNEEDEDKAFISSLIKTPEINPNEEI